MDWTESLEIVVARTKHERYRYLCSEECPDRELWRARVVEKATGVLPPAPSYPPLATQAGNLAGAVARVVAAAVQGGPVMGAAAIPAGRPVAEAIELARRMRACPFRSVDAGCGCSGGRCSLRGGAVVSHLECFPCVERYG